jgi:hypothetical protein
VPLKRVEPGEIITADFFNQIVDAINSLAERVAALEQQGAAGSASTHPKPKKTRKRRGR